MRFWRDQTIVAAICAAAGFWLLAVGSRPCVASSSLPGTCLLSWPDWVFSFSGAIFGGRLFLWFFMSQTKEKYLRQWIETLERATGLKWFSGLMKWWFVVGMRDDKSNA
jgi:hypothetical protein